MLFKRTPVRVLTHARTHAGGRFRMFACARVRIDGRP